MLPRNWKELRNERENKKAMGQRSIKTLLLTGAMADATPEGGQTPVDCVGLKGVTDFVLTAKSTAGTSPTLATKLQSSPDPAISHSYVLATAANAIDVQLRVGAADSVRLAAKFVQAATGTVKSIWLPLKERGTIPDGTVLTLAIQADDSGDPSGTDLKTATVALSSLTSSYVNYEFSFTGFDLAAGTYWLVLTSDYTASGTNNVAWKAESGLVSGGNQSVYDGTVWAADVDDSQIFTMYQYVFSDVTGGAFTGVTTTGSIQRLELNMDTLTVGRYLRVHTAVGGTSTPSFQMAVAAVGFDEDA